MKRRSMLVGYYQPKQDSANVVRQPVNVDRFDAIKASVASNPDEFQKYLNLIMNRIG